MLFEGWLDKLRDEEEKPKAFDTLMRASNAGMCTRRLFFHIDDTAFDATPADRWRMWLGTLAHKSIEEDMVPAVQSDEWLDIETEPKFDLTDQGVSCSGSGDLKIETKDRQVGVVEIKTVGGTKMKNRAFDWNGGPAGPEAYHVRQVGLAMQGLDAQWAVLLYLGMENMGPQQLRTASKAFGIEMEDWDKFMAEWVLSRKELQPVIDDEMRRMRLVTQAHAQGLSAGEIPKVVIVDGPELGGRGVEIVDPETGTFEVKTTEGQVIEVGTTWQCNYCPFRGQCMDADLE